MTKLWRNPWVRWLVPVIVLLILVIALRSRVSFLEEGFNQVRKANPIWVLVTLVFSILSLMAMARVMVLLLRAGGVKVSQRQATELTFAANAWSTSFPGGQAPATVLSFSTMRNWGATVILCSWYIVLSSALSTMWLVALGAAAIFSLGANISLWSLVPTLTVMTALSWAVYWAANHPRALANWVRKNLPKINKLVHRDPTAGVDSVLAHIDQLRAVTLSKKKFVLTAGFSLTNWILDIVALWAAVAAVTGHLPAMHTQAGQTTIAGIVLAYVTAKIAGVVQATPGGLGPVEAAMTGTLVAVGMGAAGALGAVFVYRMTSFVAITAIGWIVHLLAFTRQGTRARAEESGEVLSRTASEHHPR